MSLRATLVALLVCASPAAAQWHAAVEPPRAGLPPVTIDLGYAGPYLPQINLPIAMHASAPTAFDGYIGYHFAVNGRATLDTPVVARARLRPGENWSFDTFATLQRCCSQEIYLPRELAVEWRDRNLRVMAVRSAGVPPWTSWTADLQPLRVTSASGLPVRAQWYTGFESIIVPLATWLDLPQPVRDAMFRSAVPIFFLGFPRADQHLGRLERTILPIALTPGATTYAAPWPYRQGTRTAPMSWTAKAGVPHVGAAQNPYLAVGITLWAADEDALSKPVPATIAYRTRGPHELLAFDAGGWTSGFLRIYAGGVTAVLAAIAAIAAWLLLRKTPRTGIAIGVILIATALFAGRGRIRPSNAVLHYDSTVAVAPGVVDHVHLIRSYGAAPVAPVTTDGDAITGDHATIKDAEVRSSDTPPSFGLLASRHEFDAATRWWLRRELDDKAIARATMLRHGPDDHTPIVYSRLDPRKPGTPFRIGCRLKRQPDGRGSCLIAFPEGEYTGSVAYFTPYSPTTIGVAWPTGSATLDLVRTRINNASAPMPAAAMHGLIELTVPKFDARYNSVSIEASERR